MMAWIRENIPRKVAGKEVESVIDYLKGYEDLEPHNALRIFLEGGSWFAIRPSGTEPKIKFYFYARGNSRKEALELNKLVKEEVLSMICGVDERTIK